MSLSKYQSAVIHNESIRMLRRPSKTSIIDDIMHSLFNVKKQGKQGKQGKQDKRCNNSSFYEVILMFCGCNIQ